MQDSQDVILSLKNTISNKNETIETLENKILGLNQVITSLTSSNFAMVSSKVSSIETKVKHYEDLYKQELMEKKQIEDSFTDLKTQKLIAEKEHCKLLDTYTEAVKEVKKYKTKFQKVSQEKVDRRVIEDYERKIKKVKLEKESSENSMKDLMSQNSLLRDSNYKLSEQVNKMRKENEESLKTYLELVNHSIDQNSIKDENIVNKLVQEKKDFQKEKDELNTVILDLQLEVSDYKAQNENLLLKLNESWSSAKNSHSSPLNSIECNQNISLGEVKVGQRRLFIRDLECEYPRYTPPILDL